MFNHLDNFRWSTILFHDYNVNENEFEPQNNQEKAKKKEKNNAKIQNLQLSSLDLGLNEFFIIFLLIYCPQWRRSWDPHWENKNRR